MHIKNNKYLEELERLEMELRKFKEQVISTTTTVRNEKYVQIDMNEFESKLLSVYELKYLRQVIQDGGDEAVQYGIANLIMNEKRNSV